MATKEEIEKRVQDEAALACTKWFGSPPSEDADATMVRVIRPHIERVIELEEEGAKHTALTVKLAQAEQRVIEQGRTVEVLNADRSRLSADLVETQAELRTKERELEEERAAKRDVLRGRTMAENTIVELRETLRIAAHDRGEDHRVIGALRAQIAALQAVIDGHEQAIRDACADVRASLERSVNDARAAHHRAVQRCAALETTVDVLAGRLAARGA